MKKIDRKVQRRCNATKRASSKRSSPIRRKTDWSENKKERKLVALRDKKRKKRHANCSRRPKVGSKFFQFFKICQDAQEELNFFSTNYFLSKTNSVSL